MINIKKKSRECQGSYTCAVLVKFQTKIKGGYLKMLLQYNNMSRCYTYVNGKKYYPCLAINDFVALDIETTGLSASVNEIINIGAIRFRNNRPVAEFDMYIKPKQAIPAFITQLTGITNGMVKDAPSIAEVLPLLMDFVGTDIIVGHNVRFDLGFINTNLEHLGYDHYLTTYIDTLLVARTFRKNNSLENLVRDYVKHDYVEKHTGLDDAMNTARVFYVFKKLLG